MLWWYCRFDAHIMMGLAYGKVTQDTARLTLAQSMIKVRGHHATGSGMKLQWFCAVYLLCVWVMNAHFCMVVSMCFAVHEGVCSNSRCIQWQFICKGTVHQCLYVCVGASVWCACIGNNDTPPVTILIILSNNFTRSMH